MVKVVGIDLGIINFVIVVMEGGCFEVIVNVEGGCIIFLVVVYKGDEILVGQIVCCQVVFNFVVMLFEVKCFIGCCWDEVKEEVVCSFFIVKEGLSGSVCIEVNGKDFVFEQVSVEVLCKLVSDVFVKLGNKIIDVVIIVLVYFDNSQCEVICQVGEIVGLNVLCVINEFIVVVLVYGLECKGNEIVLVFDLGGGIFDVIIFELGDGVFEVKFIVGDIYFGGVDFDYCIVDWLVGEFQKEYNFDLCKDKQVL